MTKANNQKQQPQVPPQSQPTPSAKAIAAAQEQKEEARTANIIAAQDDCAEHLKLIVGNAIPGHEDKVSQGLLDAFNNLIDARCEAIVEKIIEETFNT